ncbi:RNA polymerase sigma-70 factor, Bacteroides expansion family 1 [Chitinophaga sp. YR573]|uniref:RNA polymerase sigma-70 factor n=1 Tax=Chitinophaga sp. YR573 TaxID=1881040 RepID=UPI0008D05840|nr:RNA polymerase sigma-70 factor [Chitinophaga sp. YR573]SEW19080.1 RNA polymerase sigma-70 factor, Bacteroides expansion family 1 [Chitinophaga sp. YR573]
MSSSANLKLWQQQIACEEDEKAFAELFRHFYDRLLHFCIQYVHSREAAEEIVSDVFVKIWNRRTELEKVVNLEVYLFVAVKNHSLNYLEQYSSLRISPINEETGMAELTNSVDPEKRMEWKEILFRMDQEVSRLPDQCRRVFKLIKEEGFKYKDVAEILNISPRTVETQLFRAMKRLNEVIGPYMFNRIKKK